MNNLEDYLSKAMTRSGCKSERALCKLLELNPTAIIGYKRGSLPTDDTMVKIAKVAGADEETALIHLNIWRAPPSAQKTYANILQKIAHTTATIAILAACTLSYSAPSQAANLSSDNPDFIYYGN